MAKLKTALLTLFTWIWNTIRVTLFVVFAVVATIGLMHSWTAKGSIDDRRAELAKIQEQLLKQRMHGEELESRLAAFSSRSDVRRQAIRAELGMVGENERYFIFK